MAQKKIYQPNTPAKTAAAVAAKPASKVTEPVTVHFVFDKSNYRLLIISIAIVVLGFILMSGTTDIYSDTKIVVAPLVVLSGFGVGFFAIFKKSK